MAINNFENAPCIGIIGGVGPSAGLDFVKKIFANTVAVKDQDHLNCMLISCPSLIPDRTGYLLDENHKESDNPAFGMFECARRLYNAGVRVAAVSCNTAHSAPIFSPFCDMVKENLPALEIINMLETCVSYVKKSLPPHIKKLGLLATKGTYKSRVYNFYFEKDNYELVEPEPKGQERIHEAIYSEKYGIKAHSLEIKPQARDWISYEIYRLIDRGAEAVILGCTELPLAVSPQNFNIPVIDPGLVTARSLIMISSPEKLVKEK